MHSCGFSEGLSWYPYVNLDGCPAPPGQASWRRVGRSGFLVRQGFRSASEPKGLSGKEQGPERQRQSPLLERPRARAPKPGTRGRAASDGYSAKDITVLEGLEAVRRRPGMYIGSTGSRGLHHLVYEVVDNSVDEAIAGYCDQVTVTLHPDNGVTVDRRRPRDPGRGAREGEAPGRRGGDDDPARRRQVRGRRRLQGLGRPARRRGLGRERALGAPPPRGAPRRPQVGPGLRARRAPGRAQARREGQGHGDHRSPSCPTPTCSRTWCSTTRPSPSGCARRPS